MLPLSPGRLCCYWPVCGMKGLGVHRRPGCVVAVRREGAGRWWRWRGPSRGLAPVVGENTQAPRDLTPQRCELPLVGLALGVAPAVVLQQAEALEAPQQLGDLTRVADPGAFCDPRGCSPRGAPATPSSTRAVR